MENVFLFSLSLDSSLIIRMNLKGKTETVEKIVWSLAKRTIEQKFPIINADKVLRNNKFVEATLKNNLGGKYSKGFSMKTSDKPQSKIVPKKLPEIDSFSNLQVNLIQKPEPFTCESIY